MSEAILYTKDACPFCVKAKALLNSKGVSITEINAVENKASLIEVVTRASGMAPRTVPQIFLDGKYIGGFDKLVEFYKNQA